MTEKELIYFTQWHMRCTILRYCSRESCILSVRLLADLLGRLGITAIPLATGAIGLNPQAAIRADKDEGWGDIQDAFAYRCIHKGMPESGQWYTGHLVLLAGGRYLCDPSADQFAHPQKDLHVIPLMVDLTDPALPDEFSVEAFLDGEQMASLQLPGGSVMVYDAHQDDLSYKRCMDWEDSVPGDKLYDRVIETTMGIVDLYADAPMPEKLPALPPSISGKDPRIAQLETAAVLELGYTPEELEEKSAREELREQHRNLSLEERERLPKSAVRLPAAMSRRLTRP